MNLVRILVGFLPSYQNLEFNYKENIDCDIQARDLISQEQHHGQS
jgi:hypothetical protein